MNVDGTVAAGLTLTLATPSAIVLYPGQTNTSVADVTVTSTDAAWTLSIKDGGAAYPAGHTPGHMAKLDGCLLSTFSSPLAELASPLGWDATAVGGNAGALSGSDQTVKNGGLIETIPVTYTQEVGAAEAVSVGDCFRVVVTYTAA